MSHRDLFPLFKVLLIGIAAFGVHEALFYLTAKSDALFTYRLHTLYIGFASASALILLLLAIVHTRNVDSTGHAFLLLTTVKIVIAYLFARPIIAQVSASAAFEKLNFFIVFSVFLAIETIMTIRMLNKQQQ